MYKILHIPTGEYIRPILTETPKDSVCYVTLTHNSYNFMCLKTMEEAINVLNNSYCNLYGSEYYIKICKNEFEIIEISDKEIEYLRDIGRVI